jgi:hypothetical protein
LGVRKPSNLLKYGEKAYKVLHPGLPYPLPPPPKHAAVLGSPGLVYADSQTAVNVLDASTGNTLFQYQDSSPGSYFYSPPALNSGMPFAAITDGNVHALGLYIRIQK